MPDVDSLQTYLQVVGGVIVAVGVAITTVWKLVFKKDAGGEDDGREERSKRYKAERELEVERLERKLETVIQALKDSLFGELQRCHAEFQKEYFELRDRVRDLERELEQVLKGGNR